MATHLHFRPQTLTQLAELVRLNNDSAVGFRDAAEHFTDGIMVCELRDMAAQRDLQANSLREFVADVPEQPCHRGSYRAVLRRYLQDARNQFYEGTDRDVLASIEQAEEYILSAYEHLLDGVSGTQVTEMLMTHIEHIKLDQEMLKELRDYVHEA